MYILPEHIYIRKVKSYPFTSHFTISETNKDLNFCINTEPTDNFYSSRKMKVLVTYLDRNQVFSLSEKSTKGYLQDLKSQVSSYFKIEDNRIIIIQRFDSEWDSFIDLDDDNHLHDRDKLKVVLAMMTTAV